MSFSPPPPTDELALGQPAFDELVAETAWVRALAHRLVADPHLADDLAQAACTAAIEAPPAPGVRLRAWLATVVRNRLSRHRRRERERARREGVAARTEALPSAADMVAKVGAQRRVVDAVVSLEEPYRSVVLWRFFEDLPPREIARRRRVPVATVHSQLQRALAQLRGRLDREFGERRAWVGALVPLARARRTALSLAATGAILMKTKLVGVIAALVIISLAVLGARALWPESASPDAPAADRSARDPAVRAPGAPAADRGRRLAVEPQPGVQPAAREPRVRGLLFDSSGRPLAGVAVRGDGDLAAAISDGDGSFEVGRAEGRRRVRVEAGGWATVVAGVVPEAGAAARIEPVVVAAREIAVSGRVTDRRGRAVAGAEVRCAVPPDFASRFAASLDASQALYSEWRATSGADGRFDLAAVGRVPGARLVARKSNYLPAAIDQPDGSASDVQLVLDEPMADADAVFGQVLDPFGYPLAGAQVCLGRSSAASDVDGRFALSRRRSAGAHTVTAVLRGYRPASAEIADAAPDSPTPFVYLYLGEPPLSIEGRVVDARGRAVEGARVWAADAALFTGGGLAHVEGYLAGGMTPAELRARFSRDGQLTAPMRALVEREPTAFWGWVETDAGGRFVLGGLLEREYRLGVMLVDGYRSVEVGPFPAGSRGVLVTFEPELHRVVAGRVVTAGGQPVAGVSVEANCKTISGAFGEGNDRISRSAVLHGQTVRTDAHGRFRFENLGSRGVFFSVNGDRIVDRNFGLFEGGFEAASERAVDDLEIVVEYRMHLRVELREPGSADGFSVLDAAGESLPVLVFEGGGRHSRGRWPLHDGRSRVCAVSDAARTLVLYRADVEVRRVPLALEPAIVNVIQP